MADCTLYGCHQTLSPLSHLVSQCKYFKVSKLTHTYLVQLNQDMFYVWYRTCTCDFTKYGFGIMLKWTNTNIRALYGDILCTRDTCYMRVHSVIFTGKWKLTDGKVPRINTLGACVSYYEIEQRLSVCLFVCPSVCSLSPPRSFDRSSPNLVGVCRWTSELPLRGSFSKRSTGRYFAWPVDPSSRWPFRKRTPARAIPRSTYIHPPSLAKIGQRTSEEIGNKQTDRQTDKQTNAATIYNMILLLYLSTVVPHRHYESKTNLMSPAYCRWS